MQQNENFAKQAEQAEAERQEVVDFNPYRYHAEKIRQRADGAASAYEAGRSALGYMEDIAESALIVRNGLDELSAQHERITAKLHDALDESDGDRWKMRSERDAANARLHEVATACATAEQERDAALAEVERLRESKGDPSGSFDRCMKMMYERDENAKRLDAALARVAELERQEPVALANRGNQGFWVEWTEAAAGLYGSGIKLYAAPVARAQHSVPDGAADLCRFLAKLYCELDGLRYSTAKLPAEQIADALIFKWPVLQGARNQLNIKRISEQPYDESKLHSAIAAMLAAAPGNSAQHSVPDGYRLIRLEHFAAIEAQLNPEQVDAYRGRNIYDEDKVYANWNACRSALDEIKDVFQQIDWDAENELAELLAAAPGKEGV
ncbi:TPA: hypothetical protein ACPILO_005544 [Pseudomonas aeruginosa]